jgi:hypothetical protein
MSTLQMETTGTLVVAAVKVVTLAVYSQAAPLTAAIPEEPTGSIEKVGTMPPSVMQKR